MKFTARQIGITSTGVLFALAMTGCGAIAEEAIEQAIEAESGEEVEIDFDSDDGTLSIEGENGEELSIDIDEDGEGSVMSGVDEAGNEFEFSAGAELPDEWPSDIPVPPGTIVSSTVLADTGIQVVNLVTEVEDSAAAHDSYASQLTDDGFTLDSTSSFESDGQSSKFTEVSRGEWTGMISSGFDGTEGPQTLVISFQATSE